LDLKVSKEGGDHLVLLVLWGRQGYRVSRDQVEGRESQEWQAFPGLLELLGTGGLQGISVK